jgi:hypothetical protein
MRTQLLSDLNHGVPPTAKQLQFVMHTADDKVRNLSSLQHSLNPLAMRCAYADAVWECVHRCAGRRHRQRHQTHRAIIRNFAVEVAHRQGFQTKLIIMQASAREGGEHGEGGEARAGAEGGG